MFVLWLFVYAFSLCGWQVWRWYILDFSADPGCKNNVIYHHKGNFNLEKVVSPGVSCGGRSRAPLLRAVRSLHHRSRSLVHITSSKSDQLLVHVELWQGCPLSLVLFTIFTHRISRCIQGLEGVRFGNPALFRWCSPVGLIKPGPPACTNLSRLVERSTHLPQVKEFPCNNKGGVPGCHTGTRPQGRHRTRWTDYVSLLAWERLGILLEELEEVSEVREDWASLFWLLSPQPAPEKDDFNQGQSVFILHYYSSTRGGSNSPHFCREVTSKWQQKDKLF